jgi:hypothetical protein
MFAKQVLKKETVIDVLKCALRQRLLLPVLICGRMLMQVDERHQAEQRKLVQGVVGSRHRCNDMDFDLVVERADVLVERSEV